MHVIWCLYGLDGEEGVGGIEGKTRMLGFPGGDRTRVNAFSFSDSKTTLHLGIPEWINTKKRSSSNVIEETGGGELRRGHYI